MPPEMKRQNAFQEEEPLKTDACKICHQSEKVGKWVRLTCSCCIFIDYYIAHARCLENTKTCKKCQTPFVKLLSRTEEIQLRIHGKLQGIQEMYSTFRLQIWVLLILLIGSVMLYDSYQCISIEKIDHSQLPESDLKPEYLWLPVMDIQCFKSSWTLILIFNKFNFYSLSLAAIIIILLKNYAVPPPSLIKHVK